MKTKKMDIGVKEGREENGPVVRTKKRTIKEAVSEESSVCLDDLDKELEELEGDHLISEKIMSSVVNRFKIEHVCGSAVEFDKLGFERDAESIGAGKGVSRCKILVCASAEYRTCERFYVVLVGMMSDYYHAPGDDISTIGRFDRNTRTLIVKILKTVPNTFSDIALVVGTPSLKIKVTNLTAKSDCNRANMLRSLFAPSGDFSVAGLKGTIQHSVFEKVMLTPDALDATRMRSVVFDEMKQEIEQIFVMDINFDEFQKELIKAIENVVKWKEKYLGQNKPTIFVNDKVRIYLLDILLTERAFSSDVFGLTGIVDAILSCKIENMEKGRVVSSSIISFPFELKTGLKIKEEYESQVLIYNYLMREETGNYDTGHGLVYYSNVDNRVDYVALSHLRFYNLMQKRNKIISETRALKHSFENILQYVLPPRTSDVFTCNYCDHKAACVVSAVMQKTYSQPSMLSAVVSQKSYDLSSKDSIKIAFSNDFSNSNSKSLSLKKVTMPCEVNADNIDELLDELEFSTNLQSAQKASIPDLESFFTPEEPKFAGFKEIYDRLTLQKVNYFAKWMDLILIEESFCLKSNSKDKSEEYGQYATVLDFDSYDELKIYLKDNRSDRELLLKFTHFFKTEVEASLFLEKVSRGQSITLKHPAMNIIIYGVVKAKSLRRKEIFMGEFFVMNLLIMCRQSHITNAFKSSNSKINYEKITVGWEYYDPVYVFENKMRTNIVRIVSEEEQKHLAEVIVYEEPPKYSNIITEKTIAEWIGPFNLNQPQKDAILKSLNTENFNLILGMPGTGKTFLIALLLFCLVKLNKKVLITSYTHTALDNIIKAYLHRFKSHAKVVTRLRQSKTNTDKDISDLNYDPSAFNHSDDLADFIKMKQLYFTTCLSLRCPILQKVKFDYVIVDEASQTLEPIIIESLFFSKKFVLIGDYFQLTPLVKSKDSLAKGMAVSLFERLSKLHLKQLCRLTDQFRMNKDIMTISNVLVYENYLKPANDHIANQKLKLDFGGERAAQFAQEQIWVKEILTWEPGVIMVDVDPFEHWRKNSQEVRQLKENKIKTESFKKRSLNSKQSQSKPLSQLSAQRDSQSCNDTSFLLEEEDNIYLTEQLEEDISVLLIEKFIKYGIDPAQITVITPYNTERAYLYSRLDNNDVEVLTIDKSQGIDRDMIVFVCPCRMDRDDSELLSNWRRINVAFTRAKKKLMFVGSKRRMSEIVLLKELIDLLQSHKWIYNFEEALTNCFNF